MAHVETNEQFLESRGRIGRYATFGGLVVIFAGLLASLNNQILLAYAALILGFILSNAGAYFLNRWGLKSHEKLSAALKGLDKRYRLYNFLLPAPNVMLTPYGVTVFLLKNLDGPIQGDPKGWRQSSGFLGGIIRLMRALSAEPLGNPPKDLEAQEERIRMFLDNELGENTQVPVDGYIIFTNPRAQVTVNGLKQPVLVLSESPDALKNALRRDKRAPRLPTDVYDQLALLFEKEAEEKKDEPQGLLQFWRR